jgi:hypothetical protein
VTGQCARSKNRKRERQWQRVYKSGSWQKPGHFPPASELLPAPEGYRFARKTSLLASFIGWQQEKLQSLSRCDKKILDIPFLMIKLESNKANVLYRQLISY